MQRALYILALLLTAVLLFGSVTLMVRLASEGVHIPLGIPVFFMGASLIVMTACAMGFCSPHHEESEK